jgi:hypothetical protein
MFNIGSWKKEERKVLNIGSWKKEDREVLNIGGWKKEERERSFQHRKLEERR